MISHPSGQQALAAEEAASVEAEGRPEGPLQPTAVDRHVQWLALSMQVCVCVMGAVAGAEHEGVCV